MKPILFNTDIYLAAGFGVRDDGAEAEKGRVLFRADEERGQII